MMNIDLVTIAAIIFILVCTFITFPIIWYLITSGHLVQIIGGLLLIVSSLLFLLIFIIKKFY